MAAPPPVPPLPVPVGEAEGCSVHGGSCCMILLVCSGHLRGCMEGYGVVHGSTRPFIALSSPAHHNRTPSPPLPRPPHVSQHLPSPPPGPLTSLSI